MLFEGLCRIGVIIDQVQSILSLESLNLTLKDSDVQLRDINLRLEIIINLNYLFIFI